MGRLGTVLVVIIVGWVILTGMRDTYSSTYEVPTVRQTPTVSEVAESAREARAACDTVVDDAGNAFQLCP